MNATRRQSRSVRSRDARGKTLSIDRPNDGDERAQQIGREIDLVARPDDLLVRLNVRTGDALHIGGQDFRIAGVMVSEPDRMTGSLNVGPRVMISRAGLDRTGLITAGSRAAERYLFALPAQGRPDVAEARAVLKAAFPEATIAD